MQLGKLGDPQLTGVSIKHWSVQNSVTSEMEQNDVLVKQWLTVT